jgi:hypothetical protein
LSLESSIVVGVFTVNYVGTASACCSRLAESVSPGSKSGANAKEGHPGTWEVSLPPSLTDQKGTLVINPGPVAQERPRGGRRC